MRLLAFALYYLTAAMIASALLPLAVFLGIAWSILSLARWIEFHVVYSGSVEARDKARWWSA